ncbi:unnamed protein product [Gadus morhua 'NCC']
MDFNFTICVDKVSAGGSWDHTAAQGSDTNSRGHPEPWRSTSLLYKEDEHIRWLLAGPSPDLPVEKRDVGTHFSWPLVHRGEGALPKMPSGGSERVMDVGELLRCQGWAVTIWALRDGVPAAANHNSSLL